MVKKKSGNRGPNGQSIAVTPTPAFNPARSRVVTQGLQQSPLAPVNRRRKSRTELKEALVGEDPTKNYKAPFYGYYGEIFVQNLPLWRLWTARMMLSSDPMINFSLQIRNAALMAGQVKIKGKNPAVIKWVREQWDFLWNHYRPQLLSHKKWGFAGLQVICKYDPKTKWIVIKKVKDFAPEDLRGLEQSGELVGMRVKGSPVYFPQALWLRFAPEFGHAYGTAVTRRQYPAWYEKWMQQGAKRLQQQRMIKDAWRGDIFWYPPNMVLSLPNKDGREEQVSWKELGRQVVENTYSGSTLTLPRLLDAQGKELTGYTPPTNTGGATEVFQWVDKCDDGILQGADVPTEVVVAADTGSGFSGRSIPFLVLLSNCTNEFVELVHTVNEQVLRPMAWMNLGTDPDYDIEPVSLVESFAGDIQGSSLAGGSIGGPPGQQPPPQQGPPQQQPPTQQYRENYDKIDWENTQSYAEGEAEVKKAKFSSTQFNLPGELAFEVRRLGDNIPYTDLAEDGKELNPHITVKYGLHTEDPEEVRRAVQDLSPIAIQLGPCSFFTGKDKETGEPTHDVVKLDVISSGLHTLNNNLCHRLQCTDTYPDYKPHITIAYVKPGLGEYWSKRLNTLLGKVAVFDKLIFSNKLREHFPILLTGEAQFEELHPKAPPGGITIHGQFFPGGKFIPKELLHTMTEEEKAKLDKGGEVESKEAPEGFTPVKSLGGTTGAELVKDKQGINWVVKKGASTEHAKNEYETNQLYRLMGVPVPMSHWISGKLVTRHIEGTPLNQLSSEDYEKAVGKLKEHFVADALLGNWDVIGLNKDNIIVDKKGVPWRVDNGGAMAFRAKGKSKGDLWNNKVDELTTMKSSGVAGTIFAGTTDKMIAEQGQSILSKLYNKPGIPPILQARLKTLKEKIDKLQVHDEPAASQGGKSYGGLDTTTVKSTYDSLIQHIGPNLFSPMQNRKIAMFNAGSKKSSVLLVPSMTPEQETALKAAFPGKTPKIVADAPHIKKYKGKLNVASTKELWTMPLTAFDKEIAAEQAKQGTITPELNAKIQALPEVKNHPKQKPAPLPGFDAPHFKRDAVKYNALPVQQGVNNPGNYADIKEENKKHFAENSTPISSWKGGATKSIRDFVSNGSYDSVNKDHILNFIKAVKKAPKFEGVVWRGVGNHVTPGTEAYKSATTVGGTIRFDAPACCSRNNVTPFSFGGEKMVFRMATKSGVDIQDVPGYHSESEVIQQGGITFKVVGVHPGIKIGGKHTAMFVDLEEVEAHGFAFTEG